MKTLFRVLQFKAGNETSGEEPAGYSDLGSTAGAAARRMQENRSGSGLRALRVVHHHHQHTTFFAMQTIDADSQDSCLRHMH